ncbi:flagellar biosynthetic protein FliO [Fictibacillus nanhaiensis]|uniref:flagellar biosynthetic protein FliO n=1 Tax=Fictibacillus nanhaiensis TaxID=742169 RepID=UPI001C953370|nr:flagellar biosynthetic protein FliO [Fictibacillus nanhaiensis]MBY6036081.1 flagellar biosynthetic protein FliO [Fictibacillus nanhaiensis]
MFKWFIGLITAVCLSFVPVTVQAEGNSQGKSVYDTINNSKSDDKEKKQNTELKTAPDEGGTFFMLVKLIFMLGIVLAILFFVLRFIQKKSVSFQDGKNLQSLGGIGVGQNRSVQLIKTGNTVLVLGVGDTVTLLKEITDEAEVDAMLEQRPAQSVGTVTSQLKSRLLNRNETETRSKDNVDPKTNFKNMLHSILNDKKEQRKEIEKAFEKGKHHE